VVGSVILLFLSELWYLESDCLSIWFVGFACYLQNIWNRVGSVANLKVVSSAALEFSIAMFVLVSQS